MLWETMIYAAITLLVIIIGWEYLRSKMSIEGFTDGVVPEYFGQFFPRRYDVVPGEMREADGWLRNPRYFEGYVDVQKLGYKADFCRVVEKEGIPDSRIMACALAGQEGLDPFTYRTDSARAGMKFSRDDYFRDVNGDGREDYGRILKVKESPNDAWQALAVLAGNTRFKSGGEDTPDNNPPPDIADLLFFFEGIMVWYRFFDDMLDYADNTQIKIAGEMKIDEEPRKTVTKGLSMNRLPTADIDVKPPSDQFIRMGENARLEFDTRVQLRQLRAISVWAYFDEFTNNARIFDFGNGPGHDNVLLGIEAKGNVENAFGLMNARPGDDNKVCNARAPAEVSPQEFMLTTEANVAEFDCPGPEPVQNTYPEDELTPGVDPRANLLFEIWDTQQRKMRLRAQNAIPLRKWTHIALTTTDSSNFRPTWRVYIDGQMVLEQLDGFMPLKSYTTDNYIGRSNWETESQAFENPDERFRGALFDFRLYRQPMSEGKIDKTYRWGHKKLGIQEPRPMASASSEGFPYPPPQPVLKSSNGDFPGLSKSPNAL